MPFSELNCSLAGLSGALPQRDTYTSQVWAAYAGPSYTTQLGDLNVNASYRLGYARVDDSVDQNFVGAQPNGSFADSWTHSLLGSVGFSPDTRWFVTAALRLGQRDTATTASILSLFAIWGTISGRGPFVQPGVDKLNNSFLLPLTFIGIPAFMVLAIVPILATNLLNAFAAFT